MINNSNKCFKIIHEREILGKIFYDFTVNHINKLDKGMLLFPKHCNKVHFRYDSITFADGNLH